MKNIFAFLFYYSGIELLLGFFFKRNDPAIIMYHSVQKQTSLTQLAGYSISPERFERDMRFLKRYNVVKISDVFKSTFKVKNSIIITFDDGYMDNYTYAYPILKKYNYSAIVYLTTKYIGTTQWLPLNKLYNAVINTEHKSINLNGLSEYGFDDTQRELGNYQDIHNTTRYIRSILKKLDIETQEIVVDKIVKLLQIKNISANELDMLDWNRIEKMRDLFEFGAHTHSHAILSRNTPEKQRDEITKSKNVLIEKLGEIDLHFAYPNGHKEDYNDSSIELLKTNNFKTAVTTIHGISDGFSRPFELKRITTEIPRHVLALELSGFYKLIRKVFKK